jgi:monovalent cation:H+ antiporter-2, CPA2 family
LCLKRSLEFSPDLDIVTRATQDKDLELLYQLGATEVVQPEFEASLELSSHLLNRLGLDQAAIQTQLQVIREGRYTDFRTERSSFAIQRDVRNAAQDLNNKWCTLPENSPLLGMSLAETDSRRLTGVAFMAIRRAGGEELDYPDPNTVLEKGDRLLLVGQPEEIQAFNDLADGEVAEPITDASCQWVTVQANSTIKGKVLGTLNANQQYRVQIQAIRHKGELMRFPTRDMVLTEGDRLLLCGAAGDMPAVSSLIQGPMPEPDHPLLSDPEGSLSAPIEV